MQELNDRIKFIKKIILLIRLVLDFNYLHITFYSICSCNLVVGKIPYSNLIYYRSVVRLLVRHKTTSFKLPLLLVIFIFTSIEEQLFLRVSFLTTIY